MLFWKVWNSLAALIGATIYKEAFDLILHCGNFPWKAWKSLNSAMQTYSNWCKRFSMLKKVRVFLHTFQSSNLPKSSFPWKIVSFPWNIFHALVWLRNLPHFPWKKLLSMENKLVFHGIYSPVFHACAFCHRFHAGFHSFHHSFHGFHTFFIIFHGKFAAYMENLETG